MRLPELRRRLINARLQWRQFQKDNIVAVEKDPTGEITAGSHSAVSNLIAMSLTRFHYVENGPATLSEARDRDRCIAILKRYEREVGDALEQHRVLDWWCSEETSLGKALHQYAALGIMDTELDNELTALESAILDGTSGEAVHGLLQRISTVAIGASFRYKASGVRLPQNTDEHALYLKMGLAERFENCWRNHKSVLATSARGIRTLRPVREPMKTFVQRVYRYGVVALQDWSVVGKLLGNKKGTAQPCDSEACRVKVDFVKTLVRSSNIYSCSSGVMPIADTPEGEPATEAIVPYGDALCAFEVLDVRPYSRIIAGNKHAVPMFFPCLIQRWTVISNTRVDAMPARLTLSSDGLWPEVVDLAGLASVDSLRTSLMKWGHRAPSDDGRLVVTAPSLWQDLVPLPWEPSTTPAVDLLQALAEAGFRPTTKRGAHILPL